VKGKRDSKKHTVHREKKLSATKTKTRKKMSARSRSAFKEKKGKRKKAFPVISKKPNSADIGLPGATVPFIDRQGPPTGV